MRKYKAMFNEKEEKRNQWIVAIGCIIVFVAMFATQCKGQKLFEASFNTKSHEVLNQNNFIFTLHVDKYKRDSLHSTFNILVTGKPKIQVRSVSFYFQASDRTVTINRRGDLNSRNFVLPLNQYILNLLYYEPLTEIDVGYGQMIVENYYVESDSFYLVHLKEDICIFKDLLHRVDKE